ncbi:MAG: histidine kinase [Gemmatimonadetes bacterium]|nr:histidine kinase [Gemmatimonadota bacterium]
MRADRPDGDRTERKAARLAVVLCCGSLPVAAPLLGQPLDRFVHQSWTLREGLPQSSIYALKQTRDGYLWIGTLQGLVRFDGKHFTLYESRSTPGLEGDRIVGLTETADGTLWIATQTHGLSRYRDGVFESYGIEDGLPSNAAGPAGSLTADEDGGLWAGMDRGLARFVPDRDGGRGRFVTVGATEGLPSGLVTATHVDEDGGLWAGTIRGLAYRTPGSSEWTVFGVEEGLPGGVVGSVLRRRDGTLWLGTDRGISRFDLEGSRFETYPVDGDVVFSLLEDRTGTLWAASPGAGLLRFDGSGFVRETSAVGEIGLAVVQLFEDREGHLWVGTNGNGLHRLRRSLFGSYAAEPDGRAGPMTHGTLESRSGDIWAATYEAGLIRIGRDGADRTFSVEAGLPSPTVWALAETADGTLWVGTEGGLARKDRGADTFRRVRVPAAPALDTRRVTAFAQDSNERLLVGTFLTHVARVIPSNEDVLDAELVLRPDGIPRGGGILSILLASDGSLWLGTQTAGIVRLDGRGSRFYATEAGRGSSAIRTLVERPDGSIWAGTYGSGLCALDRSRDRFRCASTDHGLPDNTVHAIVEDDRGFLWLSSNQGLFRLRTADVVAFFRGEAVSVRADVFTRADGLPSTEFNGGFQPTSWMTRDGRLLFPSTNGVAVVDPKRIDEVVGETPIMRIEALEADGDAVPLGVDVEVPAGSDRVVFDYTGIHFGNPDALRFDYRLEGHDPPGMWIEGGDDRVAVYTSLPPGPYTFRVRGALGSGEWEETSLAFSLPPLLHQARWFQALAALTLLGLVGFGAAAASRQRFRQELAKIESHRALEAERSRISRDMHDEVGASLTEITILSEIARRELSRPTQADERLDRIAATSRGLVESLGQIVWAINPKHDRLPALAAYLREHAARYLDVVDVETRLDFPTHVPDLRVSAEIRRNVFVVLKEALHNIAKHASASSVTVVLAVMDETLQLTIRDDGVGFSVGTPADPPSSGAPLHSGNGVGNMRRRAADIGGSLEVRSEIDVGTAIVLDAPLRRSVPTSS